MKIYQRQPKSLSFSPRHQAGEYAFEPDRRVPSYPGTSKWPDENPALCILREEGPWWVTSPAGMMEAKHHHDIAVELDRRNRTGVLHVWDVMHGPEEDEATFPGMLEETGRCYLWTYAGEVFEIPSEMEPVVIRDFTTGSVTWMPAVAWAWMQALLNLVEVSE